MSNQQVVQDRTILRTREVPRIYRTETPNIVFELLYQKKITHADFILYSNFRRIAGDEGACWKGIRKLAEEMGMSKDTISECKKRLAMPLPELKGKSLIIIEKGDYKNGKSDTIWIEDIWQENFEYYNKKNIEKNENSNNSYLSSDKDTLSLDKDTRIEPYKNNILKVSPSEIPKEPVPGSCHAPLAPDAPQEKVEVKKNEVAAALALFFFQILQHENPKMKQPNLKAWAQSIDRILRIDKCDPEEVRELMLWVIGDEFWHKNILSPDKLRKHYDRLLIEKAKQKKYKEKYANQTKLKSYKSQKMTKEEIENYIKSAEMNPDGTSKFWTQALKNL